MKRLTIGRRHRSLCAGAQCVQRDRDRTRGPRTPATSTSATRSSPTAGRAMRSGTASSPARSAPARTTASTWRTPPTPTLPSSPSSSTPPSPTRSTASSSRWPTPTGSSRSVKAAVAAGVPVITINSGIDQSKEFGAITHIGQSETVAGEAAGEKLKEAGADERHLRDPGGRQRRARGAVQLRPPRASAARWRTSRSTAPTTQPSRPRSPPSCRPTSRSTACSRWVASTRIDAVGAVERLGQRGQGRDVRPVRGRHHRHQGRHDPLRRRPAAVRPGLPRHHRALPEGHQRQRHRWRPADQLGPGVRHRGQRRRGRRVREPTAPADSTRAMSTTSRTHARTDDHTGRRRPASLAGDRQAAGDRRPVSRHRHLRLLRDHDRRLRHRQRCQHLAPVVVDDRHHGRRGRPADDRRGVRPLRRRDDRLHRPRGRHPDDRVRPQHLGRHPRLPRRSRWSSAPSTG